MALIFLSEAMDQPMGGGVVNFRERGSFGRPNQRSVSQSFPESGNIISEGEK